MASDPGYPPWVVLHVPHDSTWIPPRDREPFLLDDDALALELARMTDHHTHALFAEGVPAAQVVRAPVSRLVVDVERFEDDAAEPMAARGMGVVYTVTSQLEPLRRPLTAAEREDLLARVRHSDCRSSEDGACRNAMEGNAETITELERNSDRSLRSRDYPEQRTRADVYDDVPIRSLRLPDARKLAPLCAALHACNP